jgi:hypothetical protein
MSMEQMYERIPGQPGGIHYAALMLANEGKIERVRRGVYRIADGAGALPAKAPVPAAVADTDFIRPIPKHRLMAGRA